MTHEESERFDAAEQAYRESLAINVRQNNPAGEASSLGQLGNLCHKLKRWEEAAVFYRQAADKRMEINDLKGEGRARSNRANTLLTLNRTPEAREELERALACQEPYGHAAEPWTTWAVLYDLETAENNSAAAARAREQALALHLSYRRAGGENYAFGGRLCLEFRQALESGQEAEMAQKLEEYSRDPGLDSQDKLLVGKLQAITAGTMTPAQAQDPGLWYMDAAELILLVEAIG